jgi:hypothetical protein
LIPAIAYQAERNEVTAGRLEGLISSPRLRFQTTYENYTDGYSNLYRPQSVLGNVRTNLEAYASADLTGYLRLTGEWLDVKGFSQDGDGSPSDETSNLTCLFHRNNWPGWQLTYRNSRTQTESSTSEKSYIESRLEYQLNQAWAEKILLNAMKAEAFLRAGRQSGSLSADVDKQQFLQGYVRLNADLSDRFQGSMFYRRNDLNDVSVEDEKSPMTRAERLLLSLSHEEWQLVQMNLWVENNLDQSFHRNSSLKDARISQYSQLNLRMSPGEIWGALSPLYFEFSINQSLYGWGSTESSVAGWMWQLFRSSTDRLEDSRVTRNYSIRNEFRPSPGWYLQSLLEWQGQETETGSSALDSDYWRWSEELDVKVALSTRLNLGYTQYSRKVGYDRSTCYYQPSAWIEHRWAPDLLNTLYGSYRYTESDDGNIHGSVHDWEGRWDTILRRYNSLFIRRMEIRQSFSGSHTRAGGDDPERTYELTSSSSLDLYPLHSMILRLEFEAAQYADNLTPSNDYYDIALNLKMSLRF